MSGRYVLSVVYRDGVPQVIDRYEDLSYALSTRDGLRARARREGQGVRYPRDRSEHWMVHDSEDEERGYLEWET